MSDAVRRRSGPLAAGLLALTFMALAFLGMDLAGCGKGPVDPAGAPIDVTVGGTAYRLVSGGVFRSAGQLRIHLTSNADSCAAVLNVPVMSTAYLSFTVAPPASGPLAATVVVSATDPQAGEATGTLSRRTNGVLDAAPFTAADGTLTWSGGATGALVLETIDVGFAGVSGRVTASTLTLAACN